MHVSTMIRTATVGLAIAALAACSDTPSAPQQAQRQLTPDVGSFDRGGTPHHASDDAKKYADTNAPVDSATFNIDATKGGWVNFGQSYVYIPGNTICAASAGYGPATWNLPCPQHATGIVRIEVVWSVRGGHTYAEFEPAIRFDPSVKVFMVMFDKTAGKNKNTGLLWRDATGVWVNEALTDPSLGTLQINGFLVMRRIKHFSGYNIGAGGCDPTVDPTCGLGGL